MNLPPLFWYSPIGTMDSCIYRRWMQFFTQVGHPSVPLAKAEIAMVSAGDPFWGPFTHNGEALAKMEERRDLKLVVIEKHEYGWSNYDKAHRDRNAWMVTGRYGEMNDIPGQDDKRPMHQPLVDFLTRWTAAGRPLIYFRREYFRDFVYPVEVRPVNFVVEPTMPLFSKEQFLARPLDLICVWGETHPHRKIIADALREAACAGKFKAEIRSPVWNGDAGRISGPKYRQFHELGRIFVTSDGHGLGGGREWELITTAMMLRKQSHMVIRDDWEPGVAMVEFGSPEDPRPEEAVEQVRMLAEDPERAYAIYEAGWHTAQQHTIQGAHRYFIRTLNEEGWL